MTRQPDPTGPPHNHRPDIGLWELTEILIGRQRMRCAVCSRTLDDTMHRHHRQSRRAAVPGWCPCNVLAVHAACHGDIHAHPARSREQGWIVPVLGDRDPSRVPVLDAYGRAALLTCDGRTRPAPRHSDVNDEEDHR